MAVTDESIGASQLYGRACAQAAPPQVYAYAFSVASNQKPCYHMCQVSAAAYFLLLVLKKAFKIL